MTGATGYIGSAVATTLLSRDHQVLGLARSARSEATLRDRGIEPARGDFGDPAMLGAVVTIPRSGTARPTVIYNNGYDSTAEESYFAIAAAALRRGYNVLVFDGPGMGAPRCGSRNRAIPTTSRTDRNPSEGQLELGPSKAA